MKRIYPKVGKIFLDGGLNNKFERSIISENESPDCLNVVFNNGAVETREGITKLNTSAVGSFTIDGLYTRRDRTGAETMIAFAGGSAWQLNVTTFSTIPSAQSVFTTNVRIATTQYENHMFIGNGQVTPYKYNGTDFTRHGVPAPTTTSTVASNAAGPLTGDYRYKVTYVNSQVVEGNVSPSTATFTAAAATLRLSNIPTAPQSHGVNQRRLYRTVAGGSVFKRVATLNDNTTTFYDDTTADGSLGVDAPTDNGEPPTYSCILYHQNRLFTNDVNNPNQVWYSNINEPYTFGVLNFFSIGDATADLVKGLAEYNNSVVVYCEKSVYMIVMPDATPANWQVVRVKTQYGSKSPFGYFNYNNSQMFPAVQNDKFVGFASILGDAAKQDVTFLTIATTGSEIQSERIEPDVFLVQETFIKNISAIVFKNKAYVTVTYGESQTINNRIYVFDFSSSRLSKKVESWAPWSGSKIKFSQFTVYGNSLYAGSSNSDGFVYKLNSGTYADDGGAIDSYYYTKELTGYEQDTNNHKDFLSVDFLSDQPGTYFMNLTYRVDSDLGSGNTVAVDLTPGGSLWGTMSWGDNWGGGFAQKKHKVTLGTSNGNRIQFKFSNQNTVNQKFKVHWLNMEYNVKGVRQSL